MTAQDVIDIFDKPDERSAAFVHAIEIVAGQETQEKGNANKRWVPVRAGEHLCGVLTPPTGLEVGAKVGRR